MDFGEFGNPGGKRALKNERLDIITGLMFVFSVDFPFRGCYTGGDGIFLIYARE